MIKAKARKHGRDLIVFGLTEDDIKSLREKPIEFNGEQFGIYARIQICIGKDNKALMEHVGMKGETDPRIKVDPSGE